MKMRAAILAVLFIPALSLAKIGDKKADFEAQHGKPVKLATLDFWPNAPQGAKDIFGQWDMYRSDFYPPEVQQQKPYLKYKGVWFSLGKVIGEFYPSAKKDETVMRAMEESLGTSDLEENPHPGYFTGNLCYVTKDKKYYAVVTDIGTFIGTKAFWDVMGKTWLNLQRAH